MSEYRRENCVLRMRKILKSTKFYIELCMGKEYYNNPVRGRGGIMYFYKGIIHPQKSYENEKPVWKFKFQTGKEPITIVRYFEAYLYWERDIRVEYYEFKYKLTKIHENQKLQKMIYDSEEFGYDGRRIYSDSLFY